MNIVKTTIVAAVLLGGACTLPQASAWEAGHMWPLRRAEAYNWNRNYAHSQYGAPVALVVPPTATLQTSYGWGVGSSHVSRIDHQFGRDYPGTGIGGPHATLPRWPQSTNQFGVYYARGPW